MVCLENRDHSVIFETAPKYCISDSFVDHDGYSISSKGFLLTVVDRWPHTAWLSFIELDMTVVLGSDWLVFCDYGFRVSAL